MNRTPQLTDKDREAAESRTGAILRRGGMRFLDLLLPGAIVFTTFSLPLSESAKNIGYGIALATYVALILAGGWRRVVLPPIGVLFLVSLAVSVASALASADRRQAWRGVWEVFRYTSFFFLVCEGIREERWVLAFLWASVAGVGLAAVYVLGHAFIFGFTIHHFTMFSLGNKNAVAQYVVMMLSVMFGMADRVQVGRAGGALLAVAGVFLLILLGLSSARTMWVALVAVALALTAWRQVRLLLPALVLFALVVVGVVVAKPDVAHRVEVLGRTETYLDVGRRVEIWRSAFRLWRDHPWLGTGPRTFILYAGAPAHSDRARYGIPKGVTQAHNQWLHVAAEMGTLGLLAMAAWVVAVSVWLITRRREFAEGVLGAAWAGAAGALVTALIATVTEPAIGYEHALLLMGLLGVVMGAERRAARGAGTAAARQGLKGAVS